MIEEDRYWHSIEKSTYKGETGRLYRERNKSERWLLEENSAMIMLRSQEDESKTKAITLCEFQNWIDSKHNMYVRQVGGCKLPFPV